MKKLKRLLALVIAMAMVLSMSVAAFGAGPTEPGDGSGDGGSNTPAVTATNPGSITINSPIMGAKYKAYQIFDMTMNDPTNPNGFSYTIKKNSPFYDVVKAYAEETTGEGENKKTVNGLVLTPSADGTLFSVSVTDGSNGTAKFDAQKFGKYLEGKIADNTVTGATAYDPEYEEDKQEVTVAKSAAIDFTNMPLGYYLITSEYPDPYSYVYLEAGDKDAEPPTYQKWEFTKESDDAYIENAADQYAKKVYPDLNAARDYVDQHAGDFDKAWNDMTEAEQNKVLSDLQTSTKNNAIKLVNEKIAGFKSDDNTQPLTSRLVFMDSTTPHVDIMEKNEVEKWDVPVNPEGHADLPDVPDHGEPKGGKNIIVREEDKDNNVPAVYADWSEANIGDDVHYQLSINAVNSERVEELGEDGKPVTENGHVKFTVKPIKEYIIADYQNKNMEFNAEKGLKVRIVRKQADGTLVDVTAPMEYTDWVTKGHFFTNTDKVDLEANKDPFTNGGGIVIPWVEEITEEESKTRKNVFVNEEIKLDTNNHPIPVYVKAKDSTPADQKDAQGYLLVDGERVQAKDGQGNPAYETTKHYFASKYDNDVTILVDYYMTLKDTATIDEPGNKNISQFGVNYLKENEYEYKPDYPDTPPQEPKKPEEKKEKDDATVYTYALAIHKVDENGQNLAGAKLKIKGLTANAKSDGWYKVSKFDSTATKFDNATELVTDKDGNLVIEGLMTSQEVEIMETEAPAGYNKLSENVKATPKKIGSEVKTTSKVTYTDTEGNVTEVSNTEVVYKDGNGNQVAKMVIAPSGTKYYKTGATDVTKEEFEAAIVAFTGATDTDVNANQLTPVEYKVENKQGVELPSTGGIGTTIFYVVGAILVIGAGVVLITKRRMEA